MSNVTPESTELFGVAIFEVATRKIDSLAGRGLRLTKGTYNAERRLITVLSRMNDRFSAEIVPNGKFKVGDILPVHAGV